jgi:hypothetical protein
MMIIMSGMFGIQDRLKTFYKIHIGKSKMRRGRRGGSELFMLFI